MRSTHILSSRPDIQESFTETSVVDVIENGLSHRLFGELLHKVKASLLMRSTHILSSRPDGRMTVAHAPSQEGTPKLPCWLRLGSLKEMSSGAPGTSSVNKTAESPVSGSGNKRSDSPGPASSWPIFKDVGEIYSRLLDHKPVIQGEIRYFIKEFEEKRGLREMRVLKNLKNTTFEANDNILPKCEEVMHGNLNEVLKRLQVANQMFNTLQQREQEEQQLQIEKLMAGEAQRMALWEEFMKEQQHLKAVVNEEHTKAMERLKEQYAAMQKDLTKQAV